MQRSKHRIRTGVGGWTHPPWRGLFYPRNLPQRRELEYLSRQLTTIEINATFYSSFKPRDFARWRDETPDGFIFSLKGSRYCTNRRTLADARDAIARFVGQGIVELGDRLGPINWQFAPAKIFDPPDFEAFLQMLPRQIGGLRLRHTLEVRHASFRCRGFRELARRHACAITLADSVEYPAITAHTADFTYVRLMRGKDDIPTGYPADMLDEWARRARRWARQRDVFIYFIFGAKQRAPAAARALIERID